MQTCTLSPFVGSINVKKSVFFFFFGIYGSNQGAVWASDSRGPANLHSGVNTNGSTSSTKSGKLGTPELLSTVQNTLVNHYMVSEKGLECGQQQSVHKRSIVLLFHLFCLKVSGDRLT